jgi:putative hydroxymethylpyrimidine transport system substrate-binding protein
MKWRHVTLLTTLALLVTATAHAGGRLRLMLDWFPNVDHMPVYVAQQKGWFAEQGLTVEILAPSDTADALKLAAAGQVELAVSYQPQVTIAAAEGIPLKVVGRLVEHPLTTLLYLEGRGIATPADLAGKKIGYTVPGLMDVLLAAFARINGIDAYTPVNVGFTIVPALTTGRVAAVMGPFKTYETVGLRHRDIPAGYFELEKWGIPDYDELIFVCSPGTLAGRRNDVGAFARIVGRAIDWMRQHPEASLALYFKAVPEADRRTETDAFGLTLPFFASSQASDPARWRRFADFALENGLIDNAIDVGKLFP